MIRKTVIYTGHVQGVGFRFTTSRTARRFHVTGYVRNLPNGTVELVAEGEAAEVDRFLAAVSDAMRGYIDSAQVTAAPATGQYSGFDIAR